MKVRMSLTACLFHQLETKFAMQNCNYTILQEGTTQETVFHRVCHYVLRASSLCIKSPCVVMARWHTIDKRRANQLHCTCGYYTNWKYRRTTALNDVNWDSIQKALYSFAGPCSFFHDCMSYDTQFHSMWHSDEISAFAMLFIFLNTWLKTIWGVSSTCEVKVKVRVPPL